MGIVKVLFLGFYVLRKEVCLYVIGSFVLKIVFMAVLVDFVWGR